MKSRLEKKMITINKNEIKVGERMSKESMMKAGEKMITINKNQIKSMLEKRCQQSRLEKG